MGMVFTDELYDAFETVPRLIGSSNFATWERGIEGALAKTGHLDLIAENSTGDPLEIWDSTDRQISAFILGTCDNAIMSQHIHPHFQSQKPRPSSSSVSSFEEVVWSDGTRIGPGSCHHLSGE